MKWKVLILTGMMGMLLGGCGVIRTEEEYHIMQTQNTGTQDEVNKTLVARGSLEVENDIPATALPTASSELSFAVNGEKYDIFNAHEGDQVKKGELLARLDCKDYSQQRDEAKYELQRLAVEKEQLEADFLNYGMSKADYDRKKADLANEEVVLNQRISEFNVYIDERSIYADMDGTVKKMKEVDANQYSKEGETIYYLTGGETQFQASTANCAGVEEGGEYDLVMGNITYKVRLEKIEEGTKGKKDLYFSFPNQDYDASSGSSGKIHYTVYSSQDALYLPKTAVSRIGEEYYVYCDNEKGIREAKQIQIEGLYGEYYVISDGIEEGAEVICE